MNGKSTHAIIIANDLRTGRTVYFTAESGWSESIDEAELLQADSADARLAIAVSNENNTLVIDPCLAGASAARHATRKIQLADIREQIRVSGPTILDPNHVSTSQAA